MRDRLSEVLVVLCHSTGTQFAIALGLIFFTGTLLKELLKKVSEIPVGVDFDAFGRIW